MILFFEYNDASQPTLITMDGIGTLNVFYDNYGTMTSVEVREGKVHEIALAVTNAFQKLMRIVKPARVEIDI